MTPVAVRVRVHDVAAQSNQPSIPVIEAERNRCDAQTDPRLDLILVAIRIRPRAYPRRPEQNQQDGDREERRSSAQEFENWFRLH
jgi:hypothetical protein